MVLTSANTKDATLSNRQRVLAILRASSGNLLEWAGFYFFAYFTMYFAPAFFPHGNHTTQLLKTAGIFSAAFIARPFGGWFYGRLSDLKGRRAAMIHAGIVMLAGSLLLAVTPTYATIGYAAPALLLCARLLQGFAIGGGYGANATYMSEVAIKGQRGFLASFQYTTLIGGQLIAIFLLALLQQLLTHSQMLAWGWRIPFVVGTVGALVSVWLRMSLQESASPQKQNKQPSNLRELLNYKRELFTVFVTTAAGSACFYTFTVYMQKYLVLSVGVPASTANIILASALFVCMCLQPLLGALSDRIGRFIPMLLFSGLMTIFTMPITYYLTQTTNIYVIFSLMTLILTMLSFYTSIGGIIKAELFPAHIRGLGVSLSYAVANAIFGGSTESVALWLKAINMERAFYGYITFLCFISFIVCAKFLPATLKMNYLDKPNS